MKMTRGAAILLAGAGFVAGACVGPSGDRLVHRFGFPRAEAQGADQQPDPGLLALFSDVLERVQADYVEPVSERTLIDNALDGMLSGLDPHSGYLTEQQWRDMQVETSGRFGGIGLQVTGRDGLLEVVSPIDGTPAAKAGLRPGDLITAVNGKTIEGLSLSEAVAELRGPPDTALSVTVKRSGEDQPLVFTLTRKIIHVETVKSQLIGDAGVIRISEFTEQTNPGVHAAVRTLRAQAKGGLRGLVLDLRNDPGGLLEQAVAVANDFLDHGDIVSTRGRHPDDDDNFSARPGRDLAEGLPIVVLINNGTASASEIVAGALQDNHRALVLGTRSFGKGSVQTVIPLHGHGAMRLTTARYYTPDGHSIQDLGITPNVEVEATRAPVPHFGPEHEADLRRTLSNENPEQGAPAPAGGLPAAAREIPRLPPVGWPDYDAAKPATDFQLQQGLVLMRAMEAGRQAMSR